MLKKLDQIAQNPEVLIDGDPELASLFLEMTTSFFKATKDAEFREGSGGSMPDLLSDPSIGQWMVWGQIKQQNEALMNAANTVNFDESEPEPIEEEEEEELDEEAPPEAAAGEPEEDEPDEVGLEHLHVSEMEDDEEEEDAGEGDEEFENILLGRSGDDEIGKNARAEDLWGGGEEYLDPREREKREIEMQLVSKKGWEMSGETLATERPKDGLVDVDLDFDFSSIQPPDPLATSELEKLLTARIESMRFDDPVRRAKPKQNATQSYVINSEKPKLGLADEYAQMYAQSAAVDEDGRKVLTDDQKVALNLWDALDRHLNQLTERRFIAQKPRDNIDVQKGALLEVEERPVARKAPEEVMAPVGSIRQMKGESEVTPEERKNRLRSRKKKHMKERTARDAAKGVLYSETGKDGAEVKAQQDVQRLLQGKLPGIERIAPGEAITAEKKKPKVNKNFMK